MWTVICSGWNQRIGTLSRHCNAGALQRCRVRHVPRADNDHSAGADRGRVRQVDSSRAAARGGRSHRIVGQVIQERVGIWDGIAGGVQSGIEAEVVAGRPISTGGSRCAGCTHEADRTGRAGRTSRPGWSAGPSYACGPREAGRSGGSRCAGWARRPAGPSSSRGSREADRSGGSCCAGGSCRSTRTGSRPGQPQGRRRRQTTPRNPKLGRSLRK